MRPRFKIWNNTDKCWFVPTHPRNGLKGFRQEAMITQTGDCYVISTGQDDMVISIVHRPEFKTCLFTGRNDENGQKVYFNDILQYEDGKKGHVVWDGDKLGIKFGEVKEPLMEFEISKCSVVGNTLETPDYFKND